MNRAVIHLAILYDAVCHECQWSAGPFPDVADAYAAADSHLCVWRDSNPRPPDP